jgi:hypothetical protein
MKKTQTRGRKNEQLENLCRPAGIAAGWDGDRTDGEC